MTRISVPSFVPVLLMDESETLITSLWFDRLYASRLKGTPSIPDIHVLCNIPSASFIQPTFMKLLAAQPSREAGVVEQLKRPAIGAFCTSTQAILALSSSDKERTLLFTDDVAPQVTAVKRFLSTAAPNLKTAQQITVTACADALEIPVINGARAWIMPPAAALKP